MKEQKFVIVEPVQFELAIAEVQKEGVGLRILVADAIAKYKTEQIFRIEFSAVQEHSKLGQALR